MTEITWAEKMSNIMQVASLGNFAELQSQIDEIKAKLEELSPTESATE